MANKKFLTFAPNPDLPNFNEDHCFVPISLSLQLQISVISFAICVCYQNDSR